MAAVDRLTGTDVSVLYTKTGGTPYRLSGDFTSFQFNRQVDTVDVTAGNEKARYEKATIEAMDWSLTIFDAEQSYQAHILPRSSGLMSVYKKAVSQVITITGVPTGGTFTITVNGETTAGIAFGAAASAVQSALEALASVTAGDVAVTGAAGGPFTLVWDVIDGTTLPNAISVDGSGLTGGTNPTATLKLVSGMSFNTLFTGFSEDMGFDQALEIDASGVRVGEMVYELS